MYPNNTKKTCQMNACFSLCMHTHLYHHRYRAGTCWVFEDVLSLFNFVNKTAQKKRSLSGNTGRDCVIKKKSMQKWQMFYVIQGAATKHSRGSLTKKNPQIHL